jgi:hypothetical protein
VEATPLERAATIAPRKVKIDPTAAAERERKILSLTLCFANIPNNKWIIPNGI